MRARRLFWQVFPLLLLVAGVSVAAASWYAADYLRRFTLEQKGADLVAAARLAESALATAVQREPPALQETCRELGRKTALRLTLVLPSGKVLCDSAEDPAAMENHADRPEVRDALSGRTGRAQRFSFTLGQPALYVAVPLRQAGAIAGAVRLSVPVAAVDEAFHTIRVHLLGAAVVIILLGAAASYLVSRRIVRPIEELREGADRFARGDFDARLAVPRVVEIAALATSMNEMARQLSGRIATIQEQRNTLESILEGMAEGVVAVDAAKRVLLLNRTAAGMLGVGPNAAQGRSIQELSRNLPLQAFVVRALGAAEPVEEESAAGEKGALLIRARGAPLHDGAGGKIGAVIVLNDITQLHHLERVRRDFVANVSHELKTPVTSIAGFVETLLDGALDDRATAERFLEIIHRQAERLNAIVTDLLSLARLEQETGSERIAFEESGLCGLLSDAIEATRDRAAKKEIILELECPEDRSFPAQALLLSQAVVNLIDNAVTYSEPGSRVLVRGAVSAETMSIQVVDRGIGIPREHLPRLFERFYRVDKSRSRRLGGTGLGLAIVKHIAQVHGGRVTVESTPGAGSRFTIFLPRHPHDV
jgi:two-component system phosphate regulon sensor histidine kinase PhoR